MDIGGGTVFLLLRIDRRELGHRTYIMDVQSVGQTIAVMEHFSNVKFIGELSC